MVGFLGKTARILTCSSKAEAYADAQALRQAYPDPRAELWVSGASLRTTTRWETIRRALLTDSCGPPLRIFNPDELSRSAARQERCKKRNADPKEKIQSMVGRAIRSTLRGCRRSQTINYFPYSVAELMEHLANQFQPGMGWHNWGSWHIDHIKPCALFDLTDLAQVRECWALDNLQPLWARENILKRDNFPSEK